MIAVLFDNGGTLTDDPFEETLALLGRERALAGLDALPARLVDPFLAAWSEENDGYSFPFASHFLQEETWISRALLRLADRGGAPDPGEVPDLAPRILRRYRAAARRTVAAQPQVPALIRLFQALKARGCLVAVASNDRTFATRALMAWTGYAPFLDAILVSEEMSAPGERIEKPDPRFFAAAIERLQDRGPMATRLIYVGDSEANDVAAPKALGFTTVRYINPKNPKSRTWLDHSQTTAADYAYRSVDELPALFDAILDEQADVSGRESPGP
ncbi:MAG: HAD family hydrolase [Rhodospirillales bacterium]|jgi:FMN phosphatase YigB (HAD superfamily)|nr:HAD family hydrolase [Rhodospirillales bacterium]